MENYGNRKWFINKNRLVESNYSLKNATDLKYQYGRDCLEIAKTCWLKSQPRSGSNRQSDEFEVPMRR